MKLRNKTQLAIEAAIVRAGGVDVVAEELELVKGSVYSWVRKGKVPSKHIVHLAELAGMTTDMVLGVGERDER